MLATQSKMTGIAAAGFLPVSSHWAETLKSSASRVSMIPQDAVSFELQSNWQFDIFGFAKATSDNTLTLLMYHF